MYACPVPASHTLWLWRKFTLAVLPIIFDALMLMAYLTLKNASDIIPRCTKPFEVKELVGVEVPQGTVGHDE
jgi:hypothetical protein